VKNIDKSTGNESVNDTAQVDTFVDTFVDTSTVVESPTERQQIGTRMKTARTYLGLSQANFCVQSGYNVRTYQRNEEGRNEAGITLGAAFVRAGINANWLMTGEGPMRIEDLAGAETPGALDRERMRISLKAIEMGLKATRARHGARRKSRVTAGGL
jgi:DNA-binding transcriptional regulator YiaG